MARSDSKAAWLVLPFGGAIVLFGWYGSQRNTATSSDGVQAYARVERAGEGSCLVGTKTTDCFALTLQVYPTDRAPFKTTIDVNVPRMWSSRVQPRSAVTVVLDPKDPHKVSLDVEAFELPPPEPPRFAVEPP